MPVRIRLGDGITLVVQADIEDFTKAYKAALKHDELLDVENGDGKTRRINPVQILYFEDAGEGSAEDVPEIESVAAPDLEVA